MTRCTNMFDPNTGENVFDQINATLVTIHIYFAPFFATLRSRVFGHKATTGETLITSRAIKWNVAFCVGFWSFGN